MAGLFADPRLQAGFAVTVVFTPISILVTALRFSASRLSKRRIGLEDWFAFGALVFLLLWVIFLSIMASNVRGDGKSPTPAETAAINRPLWIASLMFPLNQLCAKLSILFLYQRIFGINRKYAFWIKAVGALQIVHTIENVFVNIFQCVPIYKFWAPHVDGHCIKYGIFLAVNESFNSLIDFVMAIQAVIMLRSLRTTTKTKWNLSIIFLLGGLAGVIGFVKIGVGLAEGVTVDNQFVVGVWATVQMGLSIFCCCVITFKPLTTRLGIYTRKITSWATTSGSRKHLRGSNATMESSHTKQSTWINLENGSDQIPLGTYQPDMSENRSHPVPLQSQTSRGEV